MVKFGDSPSFIPTVRTALIVDAVTRLLASLLLPRSLASSLLLVGAAQLLLALFLQWPSRVSRSSIVHDERELTLATGGIALRIGIVVWSLLDSGAATATNAAGAAAGAAAAAAARAIDAGGDDDDGAAAAASSLWWPVQATLAAANIIALLLLCASLMFQGDRRKHSL